MNQHAMAVILIIICISGCARSLPPHGELNRAVKKSLGATGLNYSSESKITNLAFQKKVAQADSGDKNQKYLDTGIEILRGFSMNADGAIDMKTKRSEVICGLHYDKDNVEVSIKFPLLIDYGSQTIYVGTSFLNTIFETAFPQAPATRGKLIRINLDELLQESPVSTQKLTNLIDKNRFSSQNMESINSAGRAGILRALAQVNDSCIIDQPLTDQDKQAGIARHIHVNLSHSDSVAVAVDLIDGVAQTLFQDGVISKKEYAVLLTLTDKQSLDGFVNKFTMGAKLDVGIARSGYVGYVDSKLFFTDKEGNNQLGIDNISSFSSYNAPNFTLSPETSGIVNFKELVEAVKADKTEKQEDSPSNSAAPDGPAISKESTNVDI
jgi:hypothetical protein